MKDIDESAVNPNLQEALKLKFALFQQVNILSAGALALLVTLTPKGPTLPLFLLSLIGLTILARAFHGSLMTMYSLAEDVERGSVNCGAESLANSSTAFHKSLKVFTLCGLMLISMVLMHNFFK